jgi:hypothetical protein
VTLGARHACHVAHIDRVLEGPILDWHGSSCFALVENGMTDVAVRPYGFAGIANVFTVVAPKTPYRVIVADVVRVSGPISLHFRKEIGLKDPLQFGD